jgi:hypothetical protein
MEIMVSLRMALLVLIMGAQEVVDILEVAAEQEGKVIQWELLVLVHHLLKCLK